MKKKNGRSKIQRLAIAGVLLALILVFLLVPMPSLSGVSLAIIPLIAVVIACQFDGLMMGLFCGLSFGLASLIASFTTGAGSLLAFAFHNPLISVFPRVMIPITCYFSYVGMRKLVKLICSKWKKSNDKVANHFSIIISSGVSAGVAVLTNTALVMTMIYAFHAGAAIGNNTIGVSFLWGITVANAPFEFAVSILGTPAILVALKAAFHQFNDKYSIKISKPLDVVETQSNLAIVGENEMIIDSDNDSVEGIGGENAVLEGNSMSTSVESEVPSSSESGNINPNNLSDID